MQKKPRRSFAAKAIAIFFGSLALISWLGFPSDTKAAMETVDLILSYANWDSLRTALVVVGLAVIIVVAAPPGTWGRSWRLAAIGQRVQGSGCSPPLGEQWRKQEESGEFEHLEADGGALPTSIVKSKESWKDFDLSYEARLTDSSIRYTIFSGRFPPHRDILSTYPVLSPGCSRSVRFTITYTTADKREYKVHLERGDESAEAAAWKEDTWTVYLSPIPMPSGGELWIADTMAIARKILGKYVPLVVDKIRFQGTYMVVHGISFSRGAGVLSRIKSFSSLVLGGRGQA
ncbi:MAG: hypothetical protein WD875_05530 [Pirellulales bacterium]